MSRNSYRPCIHVTMLSYDTLCSDLRLRLLTCETLLLRNADITGRTAWCTRPAATSAIPSPRASTIRSNHCTRLRGTVYKAAYLPGEPGRTGLRATSGVALHPTRSYWATVHDGKSCSRHKVRLRHVDGSHVRS